MENLTDNEEVVLSSLRVYDTASPSVSSTAGGFLFPTGHHIFSKLGF
jgi:hypothetical protein